MKTLITAAIMIVACMLMACKKEKVEKPLVKGEQVYLKAHVFNKGAFQPKQPVTFIDQYIDPNTGLPYVHAMAAIDWSIIALTPTDGVAESTIKGNKLSVTGLTVGSDSIRMWYIPMADIKH